MAMITSIKINYFRHCRSQDLSNAMWNWFIIIYYLLILIKISFILIMINLLSSAQLVEEESKLEKSLVEVEDQLEAKRGPLALAQTRLHTRRRRPNMERTRWDFRARGFVYVFFFFLSLIILIIIRSPLSFLFIHLLLPCFIIVISFLSFLVLILVDSQTNHNIFYSWDYYI